MQYQHSAKFKLTSVLFGAMLLLYFLNSCVASLLVSLSSCCLQAQWYHQGSEPLGRCWQEGDVVGCLLDLGQHTMMVTLNGELQFSSRGSELAAKEFDVMDGKNDEHFF